MLDRQSPLAWPDDEPRTPFEKKIRKSPFSVSQIRTEKDLDAELVRFKAKDAVLSVDMPFRGTIKDTAAALFFDLPDGRKVSICCDLYYQQSDNIRALYMVLDAMRTIQRYGGNNISQKTFTGFVALAPPKDAWKILGISKGVGEALSEKMRREYVMDAFRTAVKEGHGRGEDMAALTEARDEALKQLGVA